MVEAKGKKVGGGMAARQFQRPVPQLPKIEDDGNPRFVIFIRMENVYLWYPHNIITGGTTAKIMVASKDSFHHCFCIAKNGQANILAGELEMVGAHLGN